MDNRYVAKLNKAKESFGREILIVYNADEVVTYKGN
jgi:hypothetical protein